MTLSDDIFNAIVDADVDGAWNAREAADAILSVIAESVVPLEWGDPYFDRWDIWSGPKLYSIERHEDGTYTMFPADGLGTPCDTLEAAKSAAQADYTRRILSAIGLIDHNITSS